MLELTLIRHAPTEHNHGETFMGILDIPPDEQRLNQLVDNQSLRSTHFDEIYSSPLRRALYTAKGLFPGRGIIEDSRLIEKNLGEWAGVTKSNVRLLYPDAFLPDGHLNPLYTPPGGEDFDAMVLRIRAFLNDLVDHYGTGQNKKVAAVTHNGVIRTLRHLINGRSVNEIFSKSEQFVKPIEVAYNGKWVIAD